MEGDRFAPWLREERRSHFAHKPFEQPIDDGRGGKIPHPLHAPQTPMNELATAMERQRADRHAVCRFQKHDVTWGNTVRGPRRRQRIESPRRLLAIACQLQNRLRRRRFRDPDPYGGERLGGRGIEREDLAKRLGEASRAPCQQQQRASFLGDECPEGGGVGVGESRKNRAIEDHAPVPAPLHERLRHGPRQAAPLGLGAGGMHLRHVDPLPAGGHREPDAIPRRHIVDEKERLRTRHHVHREERGVVDRDRVAGAVERESQQQPPFGGRLEGNRRDAPAVGSDHAFHGGERAGSPIGTHGEPAGRTGGRLDHRVQHRRLASDEHPRQPPIDERSIDHGWARQSRGDGGEPHATLPQAAQDSVAVVAVVGAVGEEHDIARFVALGDRISDHLIDVAGPLPIRGRDHRHVAGQRPCGERREITPRPSIGLGKTAADRRTAFGLHQRLVEGVLRGVEQRGHPRGCGHKIGQPRRGRGGIEPTRSLFHGGQPRRGRFDSRERLGQRRNRSGIGKAGHGGLHASDESAQCSANLFRERGHPCDRSLHGGARGQALLGFRRRAVERRRHLACRRGESCQRVGKRPCGHRPAVDRTIAPGGDEVEPPREAGSRKGCVHAAGAVDHRHPPRRMTKRLHAGDDRTPEDRDGGHDREQERPG